MKKLIILLSILTLFFIETEAQYSFRPKISRGISSCAVVDSGYVRIKYTLNNRNKNDIENSEDIHMLEIGEKQSRYSSYVIFRGDSTVSSGDNTYYRKYAGPVYHQYNKCNKLFWGEYFKDYKNNTLSEYVCMPKAIPNYWYSEAIPIFQWEIQEDTVSIANYLCQKATCSFRGRNYIAWFTPEIPINNGPWKFGGLPGLILKVYDDKNDYVFECVRIENNTSGFAIHAYNHSNYGKITREKLWKLWKDIFERYDDIIGSVSISGNLERKYLPYNPLELE